MKPKMSWFIRGGGGGGFMLISFQPSLTGGSLSLVPNGRVGHVFSKLTKKGRSDCLGYATQIQMFVD